MKVFIGKGDSRDDQSKFHQTVLIFTPAHRIKITNLCFAQPRIFE
jgi:hypothetical protein